MDEQQKLLNSSAAFLFLACAWIQAAKSNMQKQLLCDGLSITKHSHDPWYGWQHFESLRIPCHGCANT
jgi:hypothetical protein